MNAEFTDEAISGADTDRLKGRQQLLAAINTKPCPFDVLVVRDRSRLSREDTHIALATFIDIAERGVEIWFYESNSRFEHGTFESDVIGTVHAAANAKYRKDISNWTTAALEAKWNQGYVVGGKVFGYDNVPVGTSSGKKAPPKKHVRNEAEAAVVREIYEHYASGLGFKRIAHTLNDKHVPTPRAQQGRRNGWDQGTIREVLLRTMYRGVETWNKTKKRDTKGRQKSRPRPEQDWKERPCPRIVAVELAARVDAKLAERKAQTSAKGDHSAKGDQKSPTRKYLLTGGLLKCECGGNYEVFRFKLKGEPKATLYYGCSVHRRKGRAICPRKLKLPVEETDARILEVINEDCLDMRMVDRVLALAFANRETPDRTKLEAERDDLATKVANLKKDLQRAMELGVDYEDIAPALAERKSQLQMIERQLAAVVNPPDRTALREAIERKIDNWREVLAGPHLNEARAILKQLVGPIVVVTQVPMVDVTKNGLKVVGYDEEPGFDFASGAPRWATTVNPASLLYAADHNRMASLTRRLFGAMLRRIWALPVPTG